MEHLEQIIIYETANNRKIVIPKVKKEITYRGIIYENVWMYVSNGILTFQALLIEQEAARHYNSDKWKRFVPVKLLPEGAVFDRSEIFTKKEFCWRRLKFVDVEYINSFSPVRTGETTPVRQSYRNWEIEDLREIGTHPF